MGAGAINDRRALAEALEQRVLMSVSLVKDLEATPRGTFDNDSQPLVALGSQVYFDLGSALWKSDGTAAGTTLVKDLGGFFPFSATRIGSQLFFAATDNGGDWQLWKSDGTTAGTVKVTDLPAIAADLDYGSFSAAGNEFFFTQPVAAPAQFELWRSDGTAAGTIPLIQLGAVSGQRSDDVSTASLNGKLFFAGADVTHGEELWTSDGTVAGTTVIDAVAGTGGSSPQHLTAASNSVFFDHTTGLWKSDGTAAGTAVVAALPTQSGLSSSFVQSMVAVGSGVYFYYGNTGTLWHSDGTSAGTVKLVTTTENVPSDSTWIADVNGTAFMSGNNARDLLKSDGTVAGTVVLKSFTSIGALTNLNGKLLFAADDGTHGSELWTSDGTAAGTVLLKDINPGAGASTPSQFSAAGGKLFFTAFDPVAGRELWTSDGTADGTKLVSDLTPGTLDFTFDSQQLALGNTMLFTGKMGDAGLYRSDGMAAGTFQLHPADPMELTGDGTTAYFTAATSPVPTLWKTDGTAAGTKLLTGVPGDAHLAASGGKVFYSTRQPFPGGLVVVNPTAPSSLTLATGTVDEMADLNGLLYFVVETTTTTTPITTTYALWKTDGTVSGTSQVATFSGLLDQLLPVGPLLYFEADNGTHAGLWVTDGSAAGVQFVSDVSPEFSLGQAPHTAVLNGMLIFPGIETGAPAPQLWETDGTPGGTRLLANLIMPNGDAVFAQQLTVAGGAVYFETGDSLTDTFALWKTDGTPSGTAMLLPDLGDTGSPIAPSFGALNGALYFAANLDPAIGSELYTADSGGITLAADINPGAAGSAPDQLFAAGSTLFFTADDGFHGRELWQLSQPTQSISGRVFDDANNDGFQQATELGLPGVTVYLDANNNGALDPSEISTTTDAAGNYRFSNLSPGTYTVRQVLPSGFARTAPAAPFATADVSASRATNGPVFGDVQISTVVMNFNYLLTLAQHFGRPGTFATGDLNGDDQVNFDDLLVLAQNYGQPLPPPAAATALAAADSLAELQRANHPSFRARHRL